MLQLLGKCSGADRVYIFDKKEKNRKEYFCLQYEWKNEDDILEKEQLFSEITVEDIPHWTDELKKGLTIQVTDCEELSPMEQGANAPKILKNREKIILCYSKELKYYYDHFVIKESAPDFPVLIAFRHVDEIIKEERNHQRELEDSLAEVKMNNEIISAISKIYYMIYRIDLQDFYYEEITGGSENHRFTGMKGTAAAHITSDSSEKVASKYRAMVKQFYDLSTLKKRLEKEESIAVDYLATDNNWHLARFIVQSRAEDGTARQVLLVIRVISEEKRREKYLIDAVEEANRANEAKSEFLSRMSHDIRTPMNAIMGFTRVARNHLHEPDKILDCLDKINLSGSNLQQLINDVLDISRIESGEFRIDSEPVKLSELCKLYEQNIRGTAEDKNQKFICNRHDIIYDTVLSDRLRIGQIYMNLLSNAVKYTPEGGTVELEVYEEPFPDKDKIRLVSIVRDNGIGMSEKFMKEMYSQFSRAIDTRVNKVQGSGLGLAIVKKIVDQMNGTIEATSRLHEGTTFRVTLDVPFIREQEVSETTAEIPFFKLRPSRIIKTLLIAEDNDLNYEILEEQLEMYGIHCVRAVNGKECVQLFEIDPSGTYDAILMDMQMPVMNGLDATRAIRRLPSPESKQIPIIALTANAYLEDVQKCKEAGMNDHMSKPVQIEQIIRTVERWMK